VILRRVQYSIYLQELVALECLPHSSAQSRLDGGQARAVDGLVVAASRSDRGLVDIHDRDRTLIDGCALGLGLAQEIGQRDPPVCLVKPVLARDLQLLIFLGSDEAPTGPTGQRTQVLERTTVVQQCIAKIEDLAERRPAGTGDLLGLHQQPCQCLRIGHVQLARGIWPCHAHFMPCLTVPRQAHVHRVHIPVDHQVVEDICECKQFHIKASLVHIATLH